MIADDPFGKNGPRIDEFLSSNSNRNKAQRQKTQQHSYHQNNQYNHSNQVKNTNMMNNHSYSSGNFTGQATGFKHQSQINSFDQQQFNQNKFVSNNRANSQSNLNSGPQTFNNLRFQPPTNARNTNQAASLAIGGYEESLAKPRNMQETSQLYGDLLEIFPDSDTKIKFLLNSYQDKRDPLFFVEKLFEENQIT